MNKYFLRRVDYVNPFFYLCNLPLYIDVYNYMSKEKLMGMYDRKLLEETQCTYPIMKFKITPLPYNVAIRMGVSDQVIKNTYE